MRPRCARWWSSTFLIACIARARPPSSRPPPVATPTRSIACCRTSRRAGAFAATGVGGTRPNRVHPDAHARRRLGRVGAVPRSSVDHDLRTRISSARCSDGTDPVVATHGVDFFTYLAAHPEAAEAFHDAMAAGARLQALMIEGSLDLSGARAVLDVGGSTGPLIAQLLASQPTLTGAVLDLDEARARRARDVHGGGNRRPGRVLCGRLLRIGAGGLRCSSAHRGDARLERRRLRAHSSQLRGRVGTGRSDHRGRLGARSRRA